MKKLLSTKEVAHKLGVNEKMVYTLIAEKGLPASKVTGKWLFPSHLVDQWVESKTINYPEHSQPEPREDLLVICGSNDLLLERTLSLFMELYPDQTAVFGNLGSLGGLKALRRGVCHMASSHLAQDSGEEYNFSFAREVLQELPAVVNFARREQGIILPPGNPKKIGSIADLGSKNLTVVNRPLGTGTRLLFDRMLEAAEVDVSNLKGYGDELPKHIDVGLEVLSGRADCGPAIRPVAGLLGLDFMPLGWERFDLLIPKDRFFDKAVQLFLNMLPDKSIREMASTMSGYDLSMTGKMIFPG
ncbi:helix-turn-helix transcriptional regulator [Desulfovibrio ferrophilus]|uniref:Helix-turn-helix domain DNA-binding protein n=1 Tax=Desulfovibrio ferrophilus TaxID=241368 RepID=A0A2Z6AVV5_9BACT|nr:helix-turn-helix transcriptional regulator [Desulfovibrio ferrophilus]BBD07343.1 helix-turn-helix domain DNA-binding protein [Desulfovibrio ferrophilus]